MFNGLLNLKNLDLSSNKLEKIVENENVQVFSIPLNHRIYTNGFLFKEKISNRKLNIEEIKKIPDIQISNYKDLKLGKDFKTSDGKIISNNQLTFDPPKILSYAYCSDTSFHLPIVEHIKYVDLLYHESTFLKVEEKRAINTGHSTADQAAYIAKIAKVKKLLLGHYSNRFPNIKSFEEEAKKIFFTVITIYFCLVTEFMENFFSNMKHYIDTLDLNVLQKDVWNLRYMVIEI